MKTELSSAVWTENNNNWTINEGRLQQTSVAGTFWRSESVGWTCGYVPSVDFCVVVGITELHFKQTMRS